MLATLLLLIVSGGGALALAEEAIVELPSGGLAAWTPGDVQLWANAQPWGGDLGPDVFLSAGVSGKTLDELAPAALCRVIQLNDEDEELCLQIQEEASREALIASFPGDLWEARETDRRLFYFYSGMIHASPRAAAAYSFMWRSDLVQKWVKLAAYREESGETELGVEQVALVARLPSLVLIGLFVAFPCLMWAVVVDPLLLQLPLTRLAIWVSMSVATASDLQALVLAARSISGKVLFDSVYREVSSAVMTACMFWLMFWLVPWFLVDYLFWVSVVTTPLLNLLALVLTLPGISLAWDSTMPGLFGVLPGVARLALGAVVIVACPGSLSSIVVRPLLGLKQGASSDEFHLALRREIQAVTGQAPEGDADQRDGEAVAEGGRVHLVEASTTTTTTTHQNGVTEVVVEEEELVVESDGEGDAEEGEPLRRRVE